MKGWLILVAVIVTHFGYYAFTDDPGAASWAFYVLRGLEGTLLFYLLARERVGGTVGVIACWFGMLEESQTAVCGMTASPDIVIPIYSGLCLEQFGPLPYAIAAATALVYLCSKNKNKQPLQPRR